MRTDPLVEPVTETTRVDAVVAACLDSGLSVSLPSFWLITGFQIRKLCQ